MKKSGRNKDVEPNIVGFVCNWGAYSGVEMAGVDGLEYSASVKLVKVMCLGRIHLGIVLRAFELGAEGVLLLGCPPEECHYESGVKRAKEMVAQARKVMALLGIDAKRLALVEVPVGGDDVLVRRVSAFVRYVKGTKLSALSSRMVAGELVEEAVG
ncbi:MAG: hydrogenase iron-sulfur subunit [Chloroflexota bacterium]